MFSPTTAPATKIIAMPDRKPPAAPPAPSCEEAEKALLGAVLIDPRQYHAAASLTPDDFFFLKHRYIWEAIAGLVNDFKPVDAITLCDALEKKHGEKKFLELGGPAYLTELTSAMPTSQHAPVYAQMVQRTSARRKILKATDELRAGAYDESTDTAALLERLTAIGEEIAAPVMGEQVEHISVALNAHMDQVERAYEHKVQGIPCGLSMLHTMIDGFHKRRVYEIAARTHHGKTAFMLTAALEATKAGYKVGFFNVADGNRHDVISRLISMEIGIAPHRIVTGRLTQAEYGLYVDAVSRLSKLNLYVRSKKGMSPGQMYNEARALQITNGLDIIFVDYLQRMTVSDQKYRTDFERLSAVSTSMTRIAERLDCPVVAGVQINRGVQVRADKRPTPSDIKGTGNFEEDADCILMIYREGVDNAGIEQPEKTEIIIGKNKINGQRGTIYARMNPITTRFWDWERIQ